MSSAKSRKHKTYRPRPVCAFGGLTLISSKHEAAEDALPISENDITDLNIAYWLAFEAMVHGDSSEESWSVIVCSLNVALILAERGIGKEFEPYLIKALDGAFRAKMRADQRGVWRFDGDAINTIREALEVHDEQVKLATKSEMRDALMEVHRRITRGNVYQAAA